MSARAHSAAFYATTSAAVPDFERHSGGRKARTRICHSGCDLRIAPDANFTRKARSRGPFVNPHRSAVVAMPADVAARTAMMAERFQPDIGDSGGDVQAGLALQADWLQRVGISQAADQKIAAEADTDRRVGADAAVIAGKLAAADPAVRCAHRPGKLVCSVKPRSTPIAAHGRDIGFGAAALAPEHAFEAG